MLELNHLGRIWFIDLDGTIVKHNGYQSSNEALLPNVKELWSQFRPDDRVYIFTARGEQFRESTVSFLAEQNITYDLLLMDQPAGARILINDCKPDGAPTAYCINLQRDEGPLKVINLLEEVGCLLDQKV
ncbi:hypothetical protein KIH24_13350 [Rhizobiales bacterium TNE-4]|nr:hypothetical protein [Rhizobiales bacterium TNE-4]MBV1828604.1 hypothetical protein [Rhizobiales bacterium TNE-4]